MGKFYIDMTFIDQTCPYINPHYLYRSVPFHHAPDPWRKAGVRLYAAWRTPCDNTSGRSGSSVGERATWQVHLGG